MKSQEFTIPQQFLVGEIKIDRRAQLERTYLRLLLDAFLPYQEAMLTYLDELMAKHAPQRVQEQLQDVEQQRKKKATESKPCFIGLSKQRKLTRTRSQGDGKTSTPNKVHCTTPTWNYSKSSRLKPMYKLSYTTNEKLFSNCCKEGKP